jgi:hypothetical protein
VSAISDQLAAEALKPQTVSNDGVTVSRRSLTELMECEKHLAAKAATADMGATVRGMFSKIVAPGGH